MSVERTVALIRERIDIDHVDTALILGSGLSSIADQVNGVILDYADLPAFPQGLVSGHSPRLSIGTLADTSVAVLGGRVHYYEQGQADVMRGALEVLAGLGVRRLLLTNAAGSVNPAIEPGDVMLISDHINFSGFNPLIGEHTDQRFIDLCMAYDSTIAAALIRAAEQIDVPLKQGVYTWFSGPSFETPAEIRATQRLGGDVVGMSTVPEVILARFLGMNVGALSVITNMGAGLSSETLSHEHTKAMAPIGAAKLSKILMRYLSREG